MHSISIRLRGDAGLRVALLVSTLTGGAIGYAAGTAGARADAVRSAVFHRSVNPSSPPITSDRRKKENFRAEDADRALERVARLPIQSWNYRTQSPSVRHVGPMAQDFYGSFGLGASDTTISATDMAAVSLLAIQALERRTARLEAELRGAQPIAAEAPSRTDSRRR